MSKHTPGPWRTTGLNVRSGDALVAVIVDHWADEKTPEPEKEANARLIAAAPDLLDALKTMVMAFHTYAPKTDGAEYNCVIEAHAAITKAKGEA